ncbi:MAG: 2OG-Fe dioxygenase family protein [Acidimicrobiia bacterium]
MSGPIEVTSREGVRSELGERGFAFVDAARYHVPPSLQPSLAELAGAFDRLEPDAYLRDGARFRQRRYGRFLLGHEGWLQDLPTAPYFQTAEHNSYAGGIPRRIADLEPATRRNEMLARLIRFDASVFETQIQGPFDHWRVEVHLFRVWARWDEPGLPTPEGVHRDGNDFFAVHLLRREAVRGGETTVYDPSSHPLRTRTLREPLDTLLVNDREVLHGVSPIVPADDRKPGHRDVAVIDFFVIRDPRRLRSGLATDPTAQVPTSHAQ